MRIPLISALFLLLALTLRPAAQEMPVPPKLQAAIFQKVFSYDRSLSGGPRVLVVFPDDAPGKRDELIKAFTDNGVRATGVKLSALKGSIEGASIVYFLPGAAGSAVIKLCQDNKVLAISGISAQAESGIVAVAIGVAEGKPKIYVNRSQLKLSDHDLSADLLRLAVVID